MKHSIKVVGEKIILNGRTVPFKESITKAVLEKGVIVAITKTPGPRGNLVGLNRRGDLLWRARWLVCSRDVPGPPNPFTALYRDSRRRLFVCSFQDQRAYVDHKTGELTVFV
jgi:hypothetical protein